MKRINISSPIGQMVAQIAIFELLQARFNLHPEEMAKHFKELAQQKGEEPIKMTSELKPQVVAEFRRVLANAVKMSSVGINAPAVPGSGIDEKIREFFDLSSIKILSNAVIKCEAEELDVVEFLNWLQEEAPEVVAWAFDRTIEILKKRKRQSPDCHV